MSQNTTCYVHLNIKLKIQAPLHLGTKIHFIVIIIIFAAVQNAIEKEFRNAKKRDTCFAAYRIFGKRQDHIGKPHFV